MYIHNPSMYIHGLLRFLVPLLVTTRQLFIGFEVVNSRWISSILIYVNYPGILSVRGIESFPQESLCRRSIAFST